MLKTARRKVNRKAGVTMAVRIITDSTCDLSAELIEEFGIRMKRNFSLVSIGDNRLINRKQWISTYRDSFKKFRIKRVSNPGILSDLAKRRHYKFNNIEFP
jgi:hypothetical protein